MANRSTASGIASGLTAFLVAGLGFFATEATAGSSGWLPVPTHAPAISGQPADSIVAGNFYDFRPSASDPNGDRLTFGINRLPSWAHFDTATGRLYGTPAARDSGRTRDIRIWASDGIWNSSLPKFTLTVVRGSAPVISGAPPTSVKEGQAYAFQPAASDVDGQPLSFAIIKKPTWATFDTKTGRLSGTPGPGSTGDYAGVSISVTDGAYTVSLAPYTIAVRSSQNSAPTIGGTPAASVQVGKTYAFQPAAADADGDALTFSIVNLPSWASFSSSTGRISGTPQAANVGSYSDIVLSVSDGPATTFLPMFSINVTAAPAPAPGVTNHPPTISGVPSSSATAGQPYAFVPSASDVDGQALTFSVANKPVWANFDPATGALSGTPSDSQVGPYSGITISVSDGIAAPVSLPSFAVTVAAAATGWATLNWVPPTQNVDGTPITDLAGYRIRYGKSADALTSTLDVRGPAVTTATIERLASGTWYFAVKAYTAASVESDLSNIAYKTIQ
jgi:hypothetical protein